MPNGVNKPIVLILTALDQELQAIKRFLPKHTSVAREIFDLQVFEVELPNYKVLFSCFFGMGNHKSQAISSKLIGHISPELVIMFGICGGNCKKVNLGDVVVGNEVVDYEPAKIHPTAGENRDAHYPMNGKLIRRIQEKISEEGKQGSIFVGRVGSGEKVGADSEWFEDLIDRLPGLLAIEMESVGVIQAIENSDSPALFLTIRGVSDCADQTKDDSVREKALENAGKFLLSLLAEESLIPDLKKNPKGIDILVLEHFSIGMAPNTKKAIAESLGIENGDLSIRLSTLDLNSFFLRGSMQYPVEAFLEQRDFFEGFEREIKERPGGEVYYFPLAHIPFIVHAGQFFLRNRVEVFDHSRHIGMWQGLETGASDWPLLVSDVHSWKTNAAATDVVFKMEVSARIGDELLPPDLLEECPIVSLGLSEPGLDSLHYQEQLIDYSTRIRETISKIVEKYPQVKRVHTFLAVPPLLAFRVGQQINQTMDPAFVVYNYSNRDEPQYGWSLNLGTNELEDYRNVLS